MKELERDLGLPAVLAISIGAMIGSGIFILPALALEMAGPAVVLAYLLAGILVLPAALSKSEMATAMPEAGGTYVYIERGMGPMLGTIAGVGTWFSLAFKGGLALVGGVPYLVLVFDLPVKPVALGLAVVLIGVNLLGAKQTGRLQVVIVVTMLAALAWFVLGSSTGVDGGNFEPFLDGGASGLLAATGLVFVSYAGVTKVASVAEEVENPDRNIPLGILGSLAFTTLLYVLVVTIIVGVTDHSELIGSATPVAEAAEATLGTVGVGAVVVAAILALVSTANAGILSSSRYPFAMARDGLVPESLAAVSDRFGTPSFAITLTGAVLLALIAFVPILEIAKLASAFQILVFVLINVAVVAFREANVEYEPSFHSPLYPWTQIAGVISGVLLLTQMGPVPIVAAVGITIGSVLWYLAYARPRVHREGAMTDAVRRQVGETVLEDTETAIESGTYEVLLAFTRDVDRERERSLLRLAADIVRPHDGRVHVVWFEETADQTPLDYAAETQSPAEIRFEQQTEALASELDVDVEVGEIVSHDTKHAVVNLARHRDVDLLITEHERLRLRSRLLGRPVDWIVRHAHCDVMLVGDGEYVAPRSVALVGDGAPFDPLAIAVAEAVAAANDGTVLLRDRSLDAGTDERRDAMEAYLDRVDGMLSVPTSHWHGRGEAAGVDGAARARGTTEGVPSGATENHDVRGGASEEATGSPPVTVHRGSDHRLRGVFTDERWPGYDDSLEISVYAHQSDRPGMVQRLLERFLF
jgi:amino acid transporter/nucleotide-binding universal stress UspA family protein